MIKTSQSPPAEKMIGYPINEILVTRTQGMIYWYSWGEHEFDIRIMRELLGLPIQNPLDTWFMEKCPRPHYAFNEIMNQLSKAIGHKHFIELMAEHDHQINEQAPF